jgi:hypothetical protein
LLVDAHADYRLSGQTIIPMDNYILNVARELRFVQPLFRGGKHHYLEEELLIALNHEVLPQVFRFPESVLGGFYVIGKGVENGQLEVNPQEAYRSEPIDEAEQKLVRALEQKGWKVHPPMKKAGCTLKYTKEHK